MGDVVSPIETFTSSVTNLGGPGPFNGFIGFSFLNEAGGTTHYGYAEIDLPASGDGTLLSYGFEATPDTAVVIPIPEPATAGLLGTVALAMLRRRRAA
jgi:hypothetical protein